MARSYYLRLAEGSVPDVLFDLVIAHRHGRVTFQSDNGCNYQVRIEDDKEILPCRLDVSIEELAKRLSEAEAEAKGVRSELVPMALHLGMADEIPTDRNQKTWATLAQKIHARMHGQNDPCVRVATGGN